jgi:outer membrane biosynthesis protein TonB
MTHQNPPISETRRREYGYAAARGERLQADSQLLADERRVGPFMIGLYFVGMIFAVFLVLWGLAHQREETAETSATAQQQQTPPQQNQQPPQQQAQPAQNPGQQNQPAPPQNQQPAAQQNQPQNAPAPKQ